MIYEKVKKMAEEELHKITERGELSPSAIPVVQLLTDIVKNVDKIEMLEEEMGEFEQGGSQRGYSREGGSSNRGYSRDGGGSYRGGSSYDGGGSYRGGSSYEEGGYSEESSYRRRRDSRGRYSRADGKEHMMHKLGEMMHDANDQEREVLERCMRELKQSD